MSVNGIGALERGERRWPQRETVELLVSALPLNAEQRRMLEVAATHPRTPRRAGSKATVTAGPWPDAAPASLPIPLTSFVGRETELREIAALLRDHRIVTLTGAGGIGKTRMALEVAAFGDDAEGRVRLVELAPLGDPSLVTATIARAVGAQQVPNQPLLYTLAAYLRGASLMLILDNCEHVVEEAAAVASALLHGCPGIHILATSREPLRVPGEQAYRLPSLETPPLHRHSPLRVDDAVNYAAISLFNDRARAADSHFTLTTENIATIAEICQRLGGVPLAIELAAARVNLLPVAVLCKKLNDCFQVLTGGARTALPRQQTMRATIDWSYGLLGPSEQRLFERLSIFVGGCTLETATAVCAGDDVADTDVFFLLSSLVDKSLIVLNLETLEPRYGMLEPFRQFARERLAMRRELDMVAHRHAVAALKLAASFNRAFDCEPAPILMEGGNNDAANWRAALHWSLVERHDVILGQRLAGELSPLFSFFLATADAHFFWGVKGRGLLRLALETADERTPDAALAALRSAQARISGMLREYVAELEGAQAALTRYRAIGDTLNIVRTEGELGHALLYLGRPDEAREAFWRALVLARGVAPEGQYSLACILRLLALATEHDIASARRYIAEAADTHKSLGHRSSLASAAVDLGECEYAAGNIGQALDSVEHALAIAPPSNAFVRCTALSDLSLYLTASARYDDALAAATEAFALARDFDLDAYAASALEQIASTDVLRREAAGDRSERAAARAAGTFGYVDARLAALGSARLPFVQPQYGRVVALLRDWVGADAAAGLLAAGATMTPQQAALFAARE